MLRHSWSACPSHRYTLGHSRPQEITCLAAEFPSCLFFKYVWNYSLELSFFIHKLIIMKPNNDPQGKNHTESKGSNVEWGCWTADVVPGPGDLTLSGGSGHCILWLEAVFWAVMPWFPQSRIVCCDVHFACSISFLSLKLQGLSIMYYWAADLT